MYHPNKHAQSSAEGGLMLRYDTRCYFNVRSKADISQLNLPHNVLPACLIYDLFMSFLKKINDFCQITYRNICPTDSDLHQTYRVGKTAAADERPVESFSIRQGTLS